MDTPSTKRFVRRDRFEFPSASMLDVDRDRIVVAGGDEIAVLSSGSWYRTSVTREIDDIAIGRNIYSLSGDELVSLTETGMKLWSRQVPKAEAIAATGGDVAVLTADGRIEVIHGETSSTRFELELPHPDLRSDGVFAAENGFLVSSWSYLTRVDLTGTVAYDINLDGQIASVGAIGDLAVAALKNETLRCVDSEGTEQWRRETLATRLTASGTDSLLAIGADRPHVLRRDGEIEPISVPVGRSVAATDDLRTVCVIDTDGTVSEYRPVEDDPTEGSLNVSIETAELGPDDHLEIVFDNPTTDSVTVPVEIDTTGIKLETSSGDVRIAAGERRVLSAETTGPSDDGDASVAVLADGELLASREVSLTAGQSEPALDVDASVRSIEDGNASVELRVTNDGDRRIESVIIPEIDHRIDAIESGETKRAEASIPVADTQTDGIELLVSSGPGETPWTVPIDLPEDPIESEIDRGDDPAQPYVVAGFTNTATVPVSDRLILEIGGSDRQYTHDVSLEPGESGTIVAFLPDRIEEQFAVSLRADGLPLRTERIMDGWSSETDRTQHRPEPTDRTSATATGPRGGTDDGTDVDEGGPERESGLQVSRSIDDRIGVDRLLAEHVTVRNASGDTVTEAELSIGDQTIGVPELSPGGSAQYERYHVFRSTDERTISGGTVRDGNATVDIPPSSVAVSEAPTRIDTSVDKGGSAPELSVSVENGSQHDIGITGAALKSPSTGDILPLEKNKFAGSVRVDDTREWTIPLPKTVLEWNDEELLFAFTTESSDDEIRTLALPAGRSGPLGGAVVGGTVVAGTYSTLTLSVQNTGDEPLPELVVEATGPHLDEFYAPKSVGTVAPEETITHGIDFEPPGSGEARMDVSVSWASGNGRRSETLSLSGPVAESDSDWDEFDLDAWTVSVGTDDGDASHVSTGYVPAPTDPESVR